MSPQLPAFDPNETVYSFTPGCLQDVPQPNGYGRFHSLDPSTPGKRLVVQPQSTLQPNPLYGNQHEASMKTTWTAPLTKASSDSSASVHHQSPPLLDRRSASPTTCYDFVLEDPKNPHGYREKRFRSRVELDQQKEDIRHLKQFGGACLSCYRSKKKCGPSTPCPPCLANNRKCIRRDQTTFTGNSSDHMTSSPANPYVDEVLEILQPGSWELMGSIDGTYSDAGFNRSPSRL
ncbi:hypothetical protein N7520_001338 [Penicillium odoratum]|uniref:uncharacterized protein n=1 Tax=Penicillium odoratum TaxID=1167516 RepID=UPI002546FB71|nr:uncharacterized protein N7520_001338 [Penicillium odoratum]KAJ5778092.1 hypothetical protein N7520_001338 [Penicillium odoratum]